MVIGRLSRLWKEYFENLQNANGHDGSTVEDGKCSTGMEKDLTWREMKVAINKMKGGKAPRVYEVSIEMVKAAGEV